MTKRLLNDDECEVVLSLDQIEWLLDLIRMCAPIEAGVRNLNTRLALQDAVLRRSFEVAKTKFAKHKENDNAVS